jgi:carbamoyltransferase
MSVKILGISCYYHDSAATLLIDGEIITAVQEERFTRIKHDDSFPVEAIKFILQKSNLKLNDIDHIVFYEKPFLKFERLLETYLSFAPFGFKSFAKSMPLWIKEKLFMKKMIIDSLKSIDNNFENKEKLFFSEHHLSHAASAFYPSNFRNAIVLTADGVGEWATTTVAIADNNNLEVKKEIRFPHSLGLLYSAFTYYTGFKVNGGEYKLMGLAPYGEPKYRDIIYKNLIDVKEDGSFNLNQEYFDYCTGLTMTNKKFDNLFGSSARDPDNDDISQFHMDIGASIQKVTEEIMVKIAKNLRKEYGIENLCLAGGVALNCVANGKILKEKIFKNIWIQPAAGDAGGSLGAALAYWHNELNMERSSNNIDSMKCSYLGPEYSDENIKEILIDIDAKFEIFTKDKLLDFTTDKLIEGKAVGWFQNKMEFGPRALGGRSIIGDARSPEMQKKLNLKVKFRESFRPFAPAVLFEDLNEWFDLDSESPYMLLVGKVNENKLIELTPDQKLAKGLEKLNIVRSKIPAVTHVDNSARIQTVTNKNGIYYDLIKLFKKKTGCPVIVNTSFNVRGEPPVNTPIEAYKCFMATDLDILVLGNCIIEKQNQFNFDLDNE